jgi:DhnA family fructose-bisphosphate aldolase class Ia
MSGADLRLRRLFAEDSGRSYIVAIDHGLTFGAQPGNDQGLEGIEKSIAGGPDGVLITPGMLARTAHLFGRRGAPSPIVRTDFIGNDERLKHYGDIHRMVCSPKTAAQLGADAVVMYCVFGTEHGATLADNVTAVAHTAAEAHEVGLPLIAEVVNWGSRAGDRRDADVLTFGARIAIEAGADAIKTEYTGDPETMRRLIDAVAAPVMVLGGAKLDSEDALFDMTRDAISAGAAGVVYGRNIWQADDPVAMGSAIRDLVHGRT